jgi:hypothetical protein
VFVNSEHVALPGVGEPSKKDLVAASAASIMSLEYGLIYAMAAFA